MACGPPQPNTPSPSIARPSLIISFIIPQRIPTPRYHFSFQEFLNNIDAEFFNLHPLIAHLS